VIVLTAVLLITLSMIFIVLGLNLVSAENLNLKITGTVNSITSDVYLKTNPNSNSGIDSYDMFVKDLPSGDYSQFYSSVTGGSLSIDSWNAGGNPRTINLVYHLSTVQSGTLGFSWPVLSGSYNATFYYYGNDSSYSSLAGSANMRASSSYPASINGNYFYAKVIVENYTAPVVDNTNPIFSSYSDNSGTIHGSGTAVFNVSVTNTNESVFLHVNNADYSATSLGSNKYSASLSLVPGTYSYYWFSYGSGVLHNYNASSPMSYIVNAANPSCGDSSCNGNETCSSCPADCGACQNNGNGNSGGGGGGGGGGSSSSPKTNSNFNINTDLVDISVKKEESIKKSFIVKNTGNKNQNFAVNIGASIKDLVFASDDSFSLAPGEEKEIFLTFAPDKDSKASVYSGNIDVKSELGDSKVMIICNVKDKSALFDVSIKIPDNYKEITPGSDLFFEIKLLNFGEIGRVDAYVNYMIQDYNGNIIESKDETVAVETQASITRTIKVHADLKPGDYIAAVNIKYDNNTASSSDTFKIVESKPSSSWPMIELALIIIIIIIIILVVIFIMRKTKKTIKPDNIYNLTEITTKNTDTTKSKEVRKNPEIPKSAEKKKGK